MTNGFSHLISGMNQPSELPTKSATHDYTVENLQKLAEEMLNDPELGCRSRVVSAFSGDGGSYTAGPNTDMMPDKQLYDFDYIIMSI
ncbi:hypothetical protein B5X24_HaOG202088 [Helicoverpa armigera]|uniref:Uncharacterized protein n=1 Tax=Helicoverpa armigera TaxID=29058 RepID=A0A2W1BTW6_HELAM|nr:hypothetical protein B5X24_HaOG202088 [Helicoverpa armigera]